MTNPQFIPQPIPKLSTHTTQFSITQFCAGGTKPLRVFSVPEERRFMEMAGGQFHKPPLEAACFSRGDARNERSEYS
ncbi:hypothetical protein, partial [Streptomyces doebereineriae]